MRESTRRCVAACLTAVVALALSACNNANKMGASTSNLLPPTTSAMSAGIHPNNLGPIQTSEGQVNGKDNMFTPPDGDTKTGGRGKTVGAIQCDPTEYLNDYHIHMFLGIIDKGVQVAMPDAVGLIKPQKERNGYISGVKAKKGGCFYWIHTHDASGIVHIESPHVLPPSAVIYKLADVMSVWGQKADANQFGPFKGKIHVFVGNVSSLGQLTVSSYQKFKGPYASIPVKSHEVVWIEVGKPFYTASQLPPVSFYMEY
jgi:hypothetical protein